MDHREDERVQKGALATAAATNKAAVILMATAMAIYVGRRGSPLAVGLVYTVFWFGSMVFSPVWGAVADITGRRRAVLFGTAVLATVTALPLVVVRSVWGMLAFRGAFAVFAVGFLPVILAIVSERGGSTSRGQELGFFNTARALGLTAGQLFAGVLLGLLAPPELFLVVVVVSATVAVAALLVDDPTSTPATTPTFRELSAEVRGRLIPTAGERSLSTHGLRWLYLGVLLRNTTVLGIGSLLPVYLVSRLGASEFLMGVLLAVNPAAQMAFMYLLGLAADRVGRKPLIVGGLAGSGLHGLVMAGAVLPGSMVARASVAALSFLLLAASWSALFTGSVAFIGDVAAPERRSELMGLRETARGVGGVVGPTLFGLLATFAGYPLTFAGGSLLALLAAGVAAAGVAESHHTGAAVPILGDD
ncbi:MFS transporter [Salinirubellus sp. GCM10025818]|uniref:MFS transporter n=1 Tax=Salinirubellus TaxID=2162630 RepID=UPI0030CB7193